MMIEYGRSAYGESQIPTDEYFERTRLIEALADYFGRAARGQVRGGLIEGPRGIGKTDLISRAIQRHLKAEPSAALICYSVQPYQLELFNFTRSYFNTFIRQYRYSREGEDADLQACVDAWHGNAPQCRDCRQPVLREICEAMGRAYVQRDATNTLSLLVNSPHYLAELQGQRCVVIFDQARYLMQIHHSGQKVPLLRHMLANFESFNAPLFFVDTAGALRVVLGEHASGDRLALFRVPRLDTVESMTMFQTLCERLGIDLSVRLVGTVISQLGGIPFCIHSIVRRAQLTEMSFDSSDRFGKVYAQEIRDGTIHWFWRAQFSMMFPRSVDRQHAAEMCSYLAGCHPQRANIARLSQQLSLDASPLQKMLVRLQLMGALDRSFGTVGLVDDPILRDVATVLAWGESSETSDSELLRRLAARRVRGATTPSAEEMLAEFLGRLQRLLESFRGQYLPSQWFHFRDDYGADWIGPEGVRKWLGTSDTMLRLPYLSAVSRMEIEPAATIRRSQRRPVVFCGSGFRDKQLTQGNETTWVTVLWPAVDPIGAEQVHETIRIRKEVARRIGRKIRQTWVLGKATFTREARQLCEKLRLFTGNMDMVDYIYDQVFAQGSPWRDADKQAAAPLEMIPVKTDTPPAEPETVELSLVAGHYPERVATAQLEEIARTAGFSLARIGQMKMAVLEAVINAAETTADPSDKITVRYVVSSDRLEVFVRNCAPRAQTSPPQCSPDAETQDRSFEAAAPPPVPPRKHLTGWGLRMIYTLADEVTIRPLEDGTEIHLTCKRESA